MKRSARHWNLARSICVQAALLVLAGSLAAQPSAQIERSFWNRYGNPLSLFDHNDNVIEIRNGLGRLDGDLVHDGGTVLSIAGFRTGGYDAELSHSYRRIVLSARDAQVPTFTSLFVVDTVNMRVLDSHSGGFFWNFGTPVRVLLTEDGQFATSNYSTKVVDLSNGVVSNNYWGQPQALLAGRNALIRTALGDLAVLNMASGTLVSSWPTALHNVRFVSPSPIFGTVPTQDTNSNSPIVGFRDAASGSLLKSYALPVLPGSFGFTKVEIIGTDRIAIYGLGFNPATQTYRPFLEIVSWPDLSRLGGFTHDLFPFDFVTPLDISRNDSTLIAEASIGTRRFTLKLSWLGNISQVVEFPIVGARPYGRVLEIASPPGLIDPLSGASVAPPPLDVGEAVIGYSEDYSRLAYQLPNWDIDIYDSSGRFIRNLPIASNRISSDFKYAASQSAPVSVVGIDSGSVVRTFGANERLWFSFWGHGIAVSKYDDATSQLSVYGFDPVTSLQTPAFVASYPFAPSIAVDGSSKRVAVFNPIGLDQIGTDESAWIHIRDLEAQSVRYVEDVDQHSVRQVVFCKNPNRIIALGGTGFVSLIDVTTGWILAKRYVGLHWWAEGGILSANDSGEVVVIKTLDSAFVTYRLLP